MTQHSRDDLWRDNEFLKTATEFEARFATAEDCRAYWIETRCLTSGTLLKKTRKPLEIGPRVGRHGARFDYPQWRS